MTSNRDEALLDEKHAEAMSRRKTSYDQRKASATREKGLVIVHTGMGKGKTSSGLGMVFRALGHEMKVAVVQFTKGAMRTGEAAFAQELPGRVDFFTLGEGFTWETQNRRRDIEKAREAWAKACQLLDDPRYHIVLLDELNIVLKFDYLPIEEVLETLRNKRPELHVVITGRSAKDELIDFADLVTEMRLVKHPYKSGIKAQPGIEY
jgi:cob(I)alamin adenosyltransferase